MTFLTNYKLGATATGTILFFLTRACFSLFGYQLLFQNAGSDSILAFLCALIFSIFLFHLLLKKRRTKKISKETSWKKCLFLLLLLLFFSIYLFKEIELVQKMWIDVPFLVLAFLFLFLFFLLTKKGLFSLSTSSFFLFFFFLPCFLLLCIGGLPLINLDYLKPFLIKPSTSFFLAILYSFLFLLPPILFLYFLSYSKIDHQKKQEKTFFLFFILGCLSILLEIFLMHLTLGSNLAAIYPDPLFALASRISSFLILDRGFFLFSFYLLFDSTIFLSVLTYMIQKSISSLFIKKKFPE